MSTGTQEFDDGIVFPCTNCNSKYESAKQLKRHNYNVHPRVEIACKHCDFKAKTQGSMYNHRGRCNKVLSIENFKCDQCDFTCKAKGKKQGYMIIYQHISSKHEGLIYTCESCEYKSEYKANFEQHKRAMHSAKVFNCTQCDYVSSIKRAMTKHTQNVHFEKKFQCEK